MNLSKRERYIAIAAGAVLGLFLLDWAVLSPWMEARGALTARLQASRDELEAAKQTLDNERRARRRLHEVAGQTLLDDASAAESQLLNAMRSWSDDAGLAVSAVRPDRMEGDNGFGRVTLRASGTGRMRHVTQFLWNVETAAIPVRIEDLQIGARTPGEDDLQLQFTLATLYRMPEKPEDSR